MPNFPSCSQSVRVRASEGIKAAPPNQWNSDMFTLSGLCIQSRGSLSKELIVRTDTLIECKSQPSGRNYNSASALISVRRVPK